MSLGIATEIATGVASQGPSSPQQDFPPVRGESVAMQDSRADAQVKKAVREILEYLPKDVVEELNRGQIDVNDPAFLDGLTDHVSRLAMADPRQGQRLLGKIIRLKKQIRRDLRDSDPDAVTSSTVSRRGERVGRNDPCPCGSGRKFKQCCLRKG
jgi:hypothetical protein